MKGGRGEAGMAASGSLPLPTVAVRCLPPLPTVAVSCLLPLPLNAAADSREQALGRRYMELPR